MDGRESKECNCDEWQWPFQKTEGLGATVLRSLGQLSSLNAGGIESVCLAGVVPSTDFFF